MIAQLLAISPQTNAQTMIGPNNMKLQSDLMTPEVLWGMEGRPPLLTANQ